MERHSGSQGATMLIDGSRADEVDLCVTAHGAQPDDLERRIGDQAFCTPGTWLRFVVCAGGRFAIRIRQFVLFSGTGLSATIRAGR